MQMSRASCRSSTVLADDRGERLRELLDHQRDHDRTDDDTLPGHSLIVGIEFRREWRHCERHGKRRP
jgi:hypothetical protein